MKKILALAAAASVMALLVLPSQAAAQDGPSISVDPPTVPAEGEYTFTVTGSGFASSLVFIVPCTYSGDPLTPMSPIEDIVAALTAMGSDPNACDISAPTPAPVSGGSFSVEVTRNIGQNFAWGAGDAARTESAAAPVFIFDPAMMADDMGDDMGDDMMPEGAAETGFGGTAGSDGNSVAVPLAATLAAVVLLGGAAFVTRRHA